MMNEVYIFDALRTPRGLGKPQGALYEVKPIDLVKSCLQALQTRNDLDTGLVDDLVLGCVTPVNDQGSNIAKTGLAYAGWNSKVRGMQINRYGTSGLEAINLAAMKVRSGWENLIVAGGLESMSRVPMGSDGGALGYDPEVMVKVNYIPPGVAADLIATIEGFDREELDAYALLSYQRAARAVEEGIFQKSFIPIYDRNGLVILDQDEFIHSDTSLEQLAELPPAFAEAGASGIDDMALRRYPTLEKVRHLHTAGNSSGAVDGAALVLVGTLEMGEQMGLKPRAKILAVGSAGTQASMALTAAEPACRRALQLAGMKNNDIDLWEGEETFAALALRFQKEMGIDPERFNVNGGSIAMGHPLAATGAMMLGTLLEELERRELQTGIVSLGTNGGMGVATIIERI